AYLGIPLLVTALIVGIARIGDLRTRLLLGIGAVFALFSLGGTLLDNGRNTAIRLPWGAVEHWPVFGSALPDRFAIVVALAAAGAAGGPRAGGGGAPARAGGAGPTLRRGPPAPRLPPPVPPQPLPRAARGPGPAVLPGGGPVARPGLDRAGAAVPDRYADR